MVLKKYSRELSKLGPVQGIYKRAIQLYTSEIRVCKFMEGYYIINCFLNYGLIYVEHLQVVIYLYSLKLCQSLVGYIFGLLQNHQLNDSTSLIGRVVREAKERRRKWAQNITPRPSKAGKKSQIVIDSEPQQKPKAADGFLPEDIVQMLAAREKYVDLSFIFSLVRQVHFYWNKSLRCYNSHAVMFHFLTLRRRKMKKSLPLQGRENQGSQGQRFHSFLLHSFL